MKEYKEKDKGNKSLYLMGYPKKINGFKQISSLTELSQVTDALIGVDELSKILPVYSKATNEKLMELLSTMAHNNNALIFTTNLTQFITKALDGFIDGFCFTRINDLGQLKNGSKAKRLLQEFKNIKINNWSLNLNNGEYIEIIDNNKIGENGLKEFPNQNIGKDWKIPK